MAEEDIGGLSAEISGDASRLWSVLQQSEVKMRQFVANYGNIVLQVRANVQVPSATAILDARRSISRQFRDPATGSITAPIQMAMPSATATTAFTRGLTSQIGTVIVNVKGNWLGWQTAPPTGTVGINGPNAPLRQPTAVPTVAAAADTLVRRGQGPGSFDSWRRADGTIYRTQSRGGGPVGSGGGFTVNGEPIVGSGGGFGAPAGFFAGRQQEQSRFPELATRQGFYGAGNMDYRAKYGAQAAAFDRMPANAPVWSFHATTEENARQFAEKGISMEDVPQNLARRRLASGEHAEFAPGRGAGQGTYVGGTAYGVEGYGRRIVAIRSPKSDLSIPPEQEGISRTTGEALASDNGALLTRNVSPENVVLLPRGKQVPGDSYDEITRALSSRAGSSGFAAPQGTRYIGSSGGFGAPGWLFGNRREQAIVEQQAGPYGQRDAAGRFISGPAVPSPRGASGRFVSAATAAAQMQPIARPTIAPVHEVTGIPSGPAGDVARFMKSLEDQGLSPEDQALMLEKLGWKDEAKQIRSRMKAETAQATARAGGGASGGRGRGSSRILPEDRARLLEDPERALAETRIAAAREEVISQPTRASSPRVAASRLIGTLFGLPEQEVQQRRVTRATNDYEKALKEQDLAQVALNKATKTGSGDLEGLRGKLQETKEASAQYATALDTARLAGEAGNSKFRVFAASFVGGVAGGLAFGAAMQVVSTGIGLLDKAFAPIFDRMTGFVGLSNKVVDALSDQARAQHGLTSIAVAASFAQAGLGENTANSIRPFIEQRVAVEAGNKAFQDQFDLIKASAQLRANPNLGITTGTGGFLGTSLFQTPGTIEQLAGMSPRGTLPQQIGSNLLPGLMTGAGIVGGFALGGPFGAAAGGVAGNLAGNALFPPNDQKQAIQRTEALQGAITDLGEAAKRGAPGVSNLATVSIGATDKLADATSQLLLTNKTSQDWVDALRASNFAIVGPKGAIATQQQYQDFFKAAQRGADITPREEATRQLREQTIPARLYQLQATAGLQRQSNQIQYAAQRAAQPFLPFGTTIPGGAAAMSPQARALTAGGVEFNTNTDIQIKAAKVTLSAQLSLLGPQFQQAGLASFDKLQGLGKQGAGLQAGIISAQVNLATAQYNEQLRLANLQQSDLLQLTKQEGATRGDNLGYLQRQVIDEQRVSQQLSLQSEQLSIQLQQRQINFQIALAGFTAPGATPAERAARIEEAKIEAQYAQKQLDIKKQQTDITAQVLPIQFKIEDTQFARALVSINAQIGLITQARSVTIDVAGMTERLAQVNAQIDLAAKDFQTYASAAEGAAVGVIGDIASMMAVYGGSAQQWFSAISTAYADGFVKYIQRATGAIIASINQLNGLSSGTTNATGYMGGGKTIPLNQQGFLGSVSKATNIGIVGEAGTETVAILRNPRQMAMGGSAGQQIVLNISVSGNVVRSDDDLKQLVARITSEVEQSISRKISLLGGRGAAVS